MRGRCVRSATSRSGRGRRGFTLIEVLIVVVLLGLAGSLVIPSMTQTGVLRVQAAVRTVVADVVYLQSDALAYQSRRAIWFGMVPQWDASEKKWTFVEGNGYTLATVEGGVLDLETDYLPDPSNPNRPYARNFDEGNYGDALIDDIDFNGTAILIFDELGGPVAELDGPDPGEGGSLRVTGSGAIFEVAVQPFTGRVTVTKLEDES